MKVKIVKSMDAASVAAPHKAVTVIGGITEVALFAFAALVKVVPAGFQVGANSRTEDNKGQNGMDKGGICISA